MKFNCDVIKQWRKRQQQTSINRYRLAMEWHQVFAVWPCKVADGDCRWFETIERRLILRSGFNGRLLTPGDTDWEISGAIVNSLIYIEYRAKE